MERGVGTGVPPSVSAFVAEGRDSLDSEASVGEGSGTAGDSVGAACALVDVGMAGRGGKVGKGVQVGEGVSVGAGVEEGAGEGVGGKGAAVGEAAALATGCPPFPPPLPSPPHAATANSATTAERITVGIFNMMEIFVLHSLSTRKAILLRASQMQFHIKSNHLSIKRYGQLRACLGANSYDRVRGDYQSRSQQQLRDAGDVDPREQKKPSQRENRSEIRYRVDSQIRRRQCGQPP